MALFLDKIKNFNAVILIVVWFSSLSFFSWEYLYHLFLLARTNFPKNKTDPELAIYWKMHQDLFYVPARGSKL